MPATRSTWLATATAWLALLVLGFPGSWVVCTGPHCDGRIEVAHSSGTCCDAEPHHRGPDDTGATAGEDHGCEDLVLGIGPGPLPERLSFDHDDGPDPQTTAGDACKISSGHATVVRPPATGPPRIDRRTALIADTVLLL